MTLHYRPFHSIWAPTCSALGVYVCWWWCWCWWCVCVLGVGGAGQVRVCVRTRAHSHRHMILTSLSPPQPPFFLTKQYFRTSNAFICIKRAKRYLQKSKATDAQNAIAHRFAIRQLDHSSVGGFSEPVPWKK